MKRFKYHQLLIARELRIYVTCAMQDEMSDDDIPEDDENIENISMSSENLNKVFKKQLEMLGNDLELPGMKLLNDLEGPEYYQGKIEELKDIPQVLTNQKHNIKIAHRKQKFDQMFSRTLKDFADNMDFLEKQTSHISKLVQDNTSMNNDIEKAAEDMNTNLVGLSDDMLKLGTKVGELKTKFKNKALASPTNKADKRASKK